MAIIDISATFEGGSETTATTVRTIQVSASLRGQSQNGPRKVMPPQPRPQEPKK